MNKTNAMRLREFQFFVHEYDSVVELPEQDQKLLLLARESAKKAYAPYSGFKVGSALLLENGKTVKGNNQENADFTDGICAERVALFYANATYPKQKIVSMAITAYNSIGLIKEPAQPCGSCRQVLVETETRYKQPIRLILDGAKKIMVIDSAEKLLPFAFKPDALG